MFERLGKLGEEYDIKLKPEAVTFSLFTPRHIPLPLRTKVAEELARMEAMEIISKVDQPTPWCACPLVYNLMTPDYLYNSFWFILL